MNLFRMQFQSQFRKQISPNGKNNQLQIFFTRMDNNNIVNITPIIFATELNFYKMIKIIKRIK